MNAIVGALSRLYGYRPEEIARPKLPAPPPTLDMEASGVPLLERYGKDQAYSFGYERLRRTVPVICSQNAQDLRVPLLTGAEATEVETQAYSPPLVHLPLDRLCRYATKFIGGRGGIWDDEVYRLLGIETERTHLRARFGLGRFLDYRLTTGLLREEMAWALATGDDRLPLREALLPSMAELTGFAGRITAGGVQTLCAFADAEGFYWIPLQKRGNSIAEGAGNWAVVPMGFHQPAASGALDPAAPSTTSLRELYEELFGGPETAREPEFLSYPAVDWIRKHSRSLDFEVTAFNLSMLHGNYDFSLLLAIHDPWFWESFSPELRQSWESESHLMMRSDDADGWRELLLAPNWETQALVTCVEGLRRLPQLGRIRGLPLKFDS